MFDKHFWWYTDDNFLPICSIYFDRILLSLYLTLILHILFCSVAAGMVAINEAVDKADSADLLLSLKSKAVSLRSITPECADNYHVELKEAKTKKDDVGE